MSGSKDRNFLDLLPFPLPVNGDVVILLTTRRKTDSYLSEGLVDEKRTEFSPEIFLNNIRTFISSMFHKYTNLSSIGIH